MKVKLDFYCLIIALLDLVFRWCLLAFFIIKYDLKENSNRHKSVWSMWDSAFTYCCRKNQQKTTMYPINLQNKSWMHVWLCKHMNMQRDGCTVGLDRNLKLILDDEGDIHSKSQENNWSDPAQRRYFDSATISRVAQWIGELLRRQYSFLGALCWEASSKTVVHVVSVTLVLLTDDNKMLWDWF